MIMFCLRIRSYLSLTVTLFNFLFLNIHFITLNLMRREQIFTPKMRPRKKIIWGTTDIADLDFANAAFLASNCKFRRTNPAD